MGTAILSCEQQDILAEVINIGFGRAAASLSALLGQRIELRSPQLSVLTITELQSALKNLAMQDVVVVRQHYQGGLSGDVLLLMQPDNAAFLIDLLSGAHPKNRRLTASDREALVEIGNILLNAYIGTLVNLLRLSLTFSLPGITINPSEKFFNFYIHGKDDLPFSILVKTEFGLVGGYITGYVILIIDMQSRETLIESLDHAQWSA